MKKIIFTLISLLSLISCNKQDFIDSNESESIDYPKFSNISNKISQTDIINYISKTNHLTKVEEIFVSPVIYNNDTLLFEVYYDGKYKVFTSDKRLPAVIAHSDNFTDISIESNEVFKSWIISEAIYLNKLLKFFPDTLGTIYKKQWDRLSSVNLQHNYTKADEYDTDDYGYWTYVSTDTIMVNTENTGHLVPEHWHQKYPYNIFVPYKYNSE